MAEDQENEPSIEEILDSIRQIISDDEEEGGEEGAPEAAPAPEAEAEPAPAPEAPEPVVESAPAEDSDADADFADILAAESEEDSEDTAEDEAADIGFDDDSEDDEVVELTDVVEDPAPAPEIAPEPVPAPAFEPEPSVDAQSEISKTIDTVLSEDAEDMTMTAFAQLAKKAAVDRSGTVSVEDIVREEIRPILRNWVDDHLPRMLERLLQEELDKIAKRAMDD